MGRMAVVMGATALGVAAVVGSASAGQVGWLQSGDRTSSDGRYYDMYPIEGTAGRTLDVSVLSPFFVPLIILYRPDQKPAANAEGSALAEGGKVIGSFPLDATGTWYLLVSQTKTAEGTYILEVAQ